VKDACVYEIELIFRYGVDFDRVATTRLIASGLSSFSLFLYVDQNRYTHIVVVVLLVGAISSKKPSIIMLRRFKWDRDEIWQECSPRKYSSTDKLDFRFNVTHSRWRP